MPAVKLDQRRVDALKPRKSVYDVRDRDLKGFGLRIWPSGQKRYFIHSQHGGRRVRKTIASAESTSAGEARARAATMLAANPRSPTRFSTASSTTPTASISRASPSASATNRRRSTATATRGPRPDGRGPWAPAAPSPDAIPGRAAACLLGGLPPRPTGLCNTNKARLRSHRLACGQPPETTRGTPPETWERSASAPNPCTQGPRSK